MTVRPDSSSMSMPPSSTTTSARPYGSTAATASLSTRSGFATPMTIFTCIASLATPNASATAIEFCPSAAWSARTAALV
jgi:hypothetical protein